MNDARAPVVVAVLGGGSWGTALAHQAARAGCAHVRLWLRDPAAAGALDRTRISPRLPAAPPLPRSVAVTPDAARALDGATLAILAVPAQAARGVLAALPRDLPPLVTVAKGVEADTLLLPSGVVAAMLPDHPAAVLSGPNFAAEVAVGLPAAAVVAGTDAALIARAADALATPAFRLYASDDPTGVGLCGAAKNVAAIAAGAAIGAGLGENARAALVTRALAEIARLCVALGGRAETASGLSGLGDLLLTCTGPASRNFAVGRALGLGATVAEALAASRGVAEGVATAPALLALAARAGVDMPVAAAVAAVLDGRARVPDAVAALLDRPRRAE